MRALAVLLFCASTASLATRAPLLDAVEWIDLTAPGALESVQTTNPKHYARIQAIIRMAEERPEISQREWTRIGAKDVVAVPMWQVSDPPKATLSFTLDETRYTTSFRGRYVTRLIPVR